MDERIQDALRNGRTIDITTTGRTSGTASRKEIWFHNVDDDIYITGTPGPRDWYANVLDNREFTFHLKEGVQADLSARARPITDDTEKREVLTAILQRLDRSDQLDTWVERSPLIQVEFDGR
jgi:hypothetical protein